MIIKPKVRGFICTTAHPEGCFKAVEAQINYVKSQEKFSGPVNVLIIGASTGYGLASRIAATFGAGARTIGVFYEKPAEGDRTASAGWYNSAAFEEIAHRDHFYAKSINGDAFSMEIKKQAAQLIRSDLQQVDLIIYSLATPRRVHPITGEMYSSVLKPTEKMFCGKTIDVFRGEVKSAEIEPANEEEIAHTVKVMGGEDWQMWIDFLDQENLLAKGIVTVAYSYIGPELTYDLYKNGSIGKAKLDLKLTADRLNQRLKAIHGRALVTIAKAVVTQSSSAIPVVPLYISILYKLMKQNGTHEGCIEQMYRLFHEKLYSTRSSAYDAEGYIRVDDLEMRQDIQEKIKKVWAEVSTDNLMILTDLQGYRDDFYQLFGFNIVGVDYDQDVSPQRDIKSIVKKESVI